MEFSFYRFRSDLATQDITLNNPQIKETNLRYFIIQYKSFSQEFAVEHNKWTFQSKIYLSTLDSARYVEERVLTAELHLSESARPFKCSSFISHHKISCKWTGYCSYIQPISARLDRWLEKSVLQTKIGHLLRGKKKRKWWLRRPALTTKST